MTALFGIHPETLVLPLMYVGIGFLLAALIALALSPAIHRRAERLTKRRLGKQIPLTLQHLRSANEQMRAEHAVAKRDLTLSLDKLHEKTALQSAALGRKTEEANRLRAELSEKTAALARIETRSAEGDDDLRSELAAAQFEANASRLALQEAEQAIIALQSEITGLTAAVENRSRLIDRQQHDIMTLTTQLAGTGEAAPPPILPPIATAATAAPHQEQPMLQVPVTAPPAHMAPPAPRPTPAVISFEARLAAIRDDKPLRDVRPDALVRRKVPIMPAPQAAKPQPPSDSEPDPTRVATDIRYDEPLSTAELLELGKAMLRQPAKDGPPHKTH
ncbi:MAG: hypothetical protein RO009_21635 [Pseudorhodoplanes sp.]|jgi:hypothetical protein|nr:hypothetical protein [Pseudorhodoplanes sp.]